MTERYYPEDMNGVCVRCPVVDLCMDALANQRFGIELRRRFSDIEREAYDNAPFTQSRPFESQFSDDSENEKRRQIDDDTAAVVTATSECEGTRPGLFGRRTCSQSPEKQYLMLPESLTIEPAGKVRTIKRNALRSMFQRS